MTSQEVLLLYAAALVAVVSGVMLSPPAPVSAQTATPLSSHALGVMLDSEGQRCFAGTPTLGGMVYAEFHPMTGDLVRGDKAVVALWLTTSTIGNCMSKENTWFEVGYLSQCWETSTCNDQIPPTNLAYVGEKKRVGWEYSRIFEGPTDDIEDGTILQFMILALDINGTRWAGGVADLRSQSMVIFGASRFEPMPGSHQGGRKHQIGGEIMPFQSSRPEIKQTAMFLPLYTTEWWPSDPGDWHYWPDASVEGNGPPPMFEWLSKPLVGVTCANVANCP